MGLPRDRVRHPLAYVPEESPRGRCVENRRDRNIVGRFSHVDRLRSGSALCVRRACLRMRKPAAAFSLRAGNRRAVGVALESSRIREELPHTDALVHRDERLFLPARFVRGDCVRRRESSFLHQTPHEARASAGWRSARDRGLRRFRREGRPQARRPQDRAPRVAVYRIRQSSMEGQTFRGFAPSAAELDDTLRERHHRRRADPLIPAGIPDGDA